MAQSTRSNKKEQGIRLQKILAKAGLASRRGAETLISQGKVSINGTIVTELGVRADPATDVIEVNGIPLEIETLTDKPITILLNKPRAVMCTAKDPEGRKTVFDILDDKTLPRLFTVGRLDYNTEGAILLTNDGNLGNRLTHPRYHISKIYHVKLQGKLTSEHLKLLRGGMMLNGKMTLPADITELGSLEKNIWYEVTLFEGRNRQIHRMMEAIGARVSRLKRVQFGNLTLDRVKVGTWRAVSGAELEGLVTGAPAANSPAPPQPRNESSDRRKNPSRGKVRREAGPSIGGKQTRRSGPKEETRGSTARNPKAGQKVSRRQDRNEAPPRGDRRKKRD